MAKTRLELTALMNRMKAATAAAPITPTEFANFMDDWVNYMTKDGAYDAGVLEQWKTETLALQNANLNANIQAAVDAASQALASAAAAVAVAQGSATARPNVRASFYLDLANSRFWPSKVPFSRASTGTYIDKYGQMKLAPANKPRFTHDPVTKESKGVLFEATATNLLKYSNDFTNLNWQNLRTSCSIDTTQNGVYTQYATKLIVDGTTDPIISQGVNFAAAGKTLTFSIYIWTDSIQTTKATLRLHGTNAEEIANKIVTVTNTPTRYSITKTFSANFASTIVYARLDPFDDETNTPVAGRYLYIDCAQLEENADASSFIPTTNTAVTRQSDNCTINGTLFNEFFPKIDEGTIHLIGHKGFASGSYQSYATFFQSNPTAGQNSIRITNLLTNNDFSATVFKDGINQIGPLLSTTPGGVFSVALSYKAGDAAVFKDGLMVATAAATIPKNINSFSIEGTNGIIKTLAFWPKRLDNVSLQTLTSNGLSGKSSNQLPTNADIGGSTFLNPYDLLRNVNRQDFSIDCAGTGINITRNIRRNYPFSFEIVDSSGVNIVTQPAAVCVENTDNSLIINGPVGKTLTYSVTPIFEY